MSADLGSTSLAIAALRGVATVQDGGRPGRMHEGVPPGGPLVRELLARANLAAGNDEGDAAIELFGGMTLTAHGGTLRVALDDGVVRDLGDGESLDVQPDARSRVRYVAVAGGIDVPVVLGGRGTLLVASLGGHEGRPLRRGDRLRARGARSAYPAATRAALPPPPDLEASVRVVVGPDADRFASDAIDTLFAGVFQIAVTGDRMGTRLDGPRLARRDADDGLSAPMLRGAIQVPASGNPIVLGPDHPTTGGYPVIGVIVSGDYGGFAARRPGAQVRFSRAFPPPPAPGGEGGE